MRRPTRSELHRRWAVVVAALVGALTIAALVVGSRSPGPAPEEAARPARPTTSSSRPPPAPSSTTTTTPTGRFVAATEGGPVVGRGPRRTYRIEVEDGTGVDVARFADEVERILSDPRGWTAADGISLQRVGGEADTVVMLATPPTVDRLCFPMETDGDVSCAPDHRAIINVERWRRGAAPSRLDLEGYRAYLISHEVGHTMGHGHAACPGPGAPAPVMVQQTLGIGECRPNPWPAPGASRTG